MSRSTPYLMLMEALVERRLSGEQFATIIQRMFAGERPGLPEAEFAILNDVTLASDSYVEDEQLRDSSDWDEDQLHDYVAKALIKLRAAIETQAQ